MLTPKPNTTSDKNEDALKTEGVLYW